MLFVKVITPDSTMEDVLPQLNKDMRDWTDRAARGECAWVCSDCCCSSQKGMPDECFHGDERCTKIIQRDKREAFAKVK